MTSAIPPPGIPLLILSVLPVFLAPGASHVPTHRRTFALALNFCLKYSLVVGCMPLNVTTVPCDRWFSLSITSFCLSFPRLREGCHSWIFLWGIPSMYSRACSVWVGGRQEGEDRWLGGWLDRRGEWARRGGRQAGGREEDVRPEAA